MEGEIMQYTNKYHSPLGDITVVSNGEALTGLWLDGQKYIGGTLSAENEERDLPIFEQARQWLDIYFRGENPNFTPPLSLCAAPFRLGVWEILKSIPYGHVMTYGDIADITAKQMSLKRMSAQAVGGAVGHNPVSIIIPCHRVVGSSGSLTGYAGGIDKKVKLLALEKIDMRHLFVPKNGTAL
jgi:methylated-DNA-[protein]-cysteine S-methyltransferase